MISEFAASSTTDDDYFANGRLQQRVLFDPGLPLQTATFGYDGHDRTSAQTAVGTPSLTTLFGLDGLDRAVLVTSPKGIQTRTQYDLAGRRAETVEDYAGALARETVFAYNRLSQLIQQIARNRAFDGTPLADQVTTYRYDSLGRPTRAVYPDAAAGQHADPAACTDCLRTTVDLAGRPDGQTDPRGTVFDFDTDARGLLLARTTGGSDRDSFAYDALRRLTAAQRGTVGDPDAGSAAALDYTDLGDLAFETQTLAGGTPRTVDYAYDQAGNRLGLTYPGGATLAYTPTALNQVDTIDLQGSPLLADYAYYGRLLNARAVTTDAAGGGTIYTVQTGYDAYRRVNAISNTLTTPIAREGTEARVAWSSSPQASAAMQDTTKGDRLESRSHSDRAVETLAAYTFTHDADGHPQTQTADGLPDFAGDDRTFTVDRLARLTDTAYAASGTTESSTFDRVGNREDHTNRAGQTTDYSLANAANEYGTISSNGTPRTVAYDAAGNLTGDEAGRQYTYDAYHRLTQVRAGAVVLANYTYDALGRRAVFEDPVRGTTVRYTYDGSNVIEERDAADALVRYHVNGAQFADERIATFTATVPGQPSGTFTYYLGGNNFSVVGTGNADGSTLTRLDYSATGDFAGGGSPGTWYAHDADDDGDVDAEDFADFQLCFGTTDAGCRSVHDVDIDGQSDGHIDLADYESFWGCCGGPGVSPGLSDGHDWEPDGDVDLADWAEFQVCFGTTTPSCLAAFDINASGQSNGVINLADAQGFERRMNGPNQPPGGACPVLGARWAARATPPSGTFALHGRAIDVLADGLVLQDFRNRVYAPQHGRWLQRDPTGYSDGSNLYEAFGNNATANTDSFGTQVYEPPDPSMYQGLSDDEIRQILDMQCIASAQMARGLGRTVAAPFRAAGRWVRNNFADWWLETRILYGYRGSDRFMPPGELPGERQLLRGRATVVAAEVSGSSPGQAYFIGTVDVLGGLVPFQERLFDLYEGKTRYGEVVAPAEVLGELAGEVIVLYVPARAAQGLGRVRLPVGSALGESARAGFFTRAQLAYERALVVVFDAQPGEVILGSGLSPGPIGSRQLLPRESIAGSVTLEPGWQKAVDFSGVEGGVVYVLRDVSSGELLKVGKTTWFRSPTRFEDYIRVGRREGRSLVVDLYNAPARPGGWRPEAYERELRSMIEELGHPLPWDNTGNRLNRSGSGLP